MITSGANNLFGENYAKVGKFCTPINRNGTTNKSILILYSAQFSNLHAAFTDWSV